MAERGRVLWHTTMSLDGFIAGPNHSMDWMSGLSFAPGTVDKMVASVGAILAGRRWHDAFAGDPAAAPYGGAYEGPIFVLTHHPDDAAVHPEITLLDCDIAEAVETALAAAGGKDLVLLGDGIRMFEAPGSAPVRLARIHDGDPARVADLRYRPAA